MELFLDFPLFSFLTLTMPIRVVDLIIIYNCSLYIFFYFLMTLKTRAKPSGSTLEFVLVRVFSCVVGLILLLPSNK